MKIMKELLDKRASRPDDMNDETTRVFESKANDAQLEKSIYMIASNEQGSYMQIEANNRDYNHNNLLKKINFNSDNGDFINGCTNRSLMTQNSKQNESIDSFAAINDGRRLSEIIHRFGGEAASSTAGNFSQSRQSRPGMYY
jgi:hypothetical protein